MLTGGNTHFMIPCPCCKATNTAPVCRRCKADLGLLFQIEARRAFHIDSAKRFAADQRYPEADRELDQAAQFRPGDDVLGLKAALHLLRGDYAAAFAFLPETP
jgi:hypothetical protein